MRKNLVGMKFGKLTVVKFHGINKGGAYLWDCKCDCGNLCTVIGSRLNNGLTKSCGCLRHENYVCIKHDLTGKRFGRLLVINRVPHEYGQRGVFWNCKCDCGNTTVATSSNLMGGSVSSCGCYRDDLKNLIIGDIAGKKYKMLTAIEPTDKRVDGSVVWKCRCDCGNIVEISRHNLVEGHRISCGCVKAGTTHGVSKYRIYRIYKGMKNRCYNTRLEAYSRYGARGIKLCDEWLLDFMSFYKWAMDNGYSDELTIDRIDNDRDYCPENCRWVSYKAQMNNKRNNVLYTWNGITKTLSQWIDILGVSPSLMHNRRYLHPEYDLNQISGLSDDEIKCLLNKQDLTYANHN